MIGIVFGIITILFLLYIQYSPGMGNIWYRNNEYFSPMGAYNVMIFPLQSVYMWRPDMWDINYFVWLFIGFIAYQGSFFLQPRE